MGAHSPRNLRVSDGWGLPRPLTRFRAPEPGGGAAGARGARRERAPGAGGRVPRARGRGAGALGRRAGEGQEKGGREGRGRVATAPPHSPHLAHLHRQLARSPASPREALAPPSLLPLLGSRAPGEAQAPSARTGAQTDGPGDASARASRAGYVDCPTGAGPRDQHSSARDPGGQRGL